MKDFFILITVACFCQTVSTQIYAAPEFKNANDGPCNVSVTEGESVTFNCNPYAIPEANIIWLQNGQQIDINNPPKRFVFSNDNRSLTIRDVCRDCVDRESKTDPMVIQCYASNVHGYAFAQGYLNVLMRTKASSHHPEMSLGEGNQEGETRTAWKLILGAGAVGLFLLLIGIFSPSRSGDVNRRKKDRRLPDPPAMREHIGCDSVNIPLEAMGHNNRSIRTGISMYEQISYASMDQLQEELALRKGATLNPDDIDDCNRYESIDVPRREAMCRGRPMVNADAIYDDTGCSIPLEEVTNDGKMTQQQIHESVQSESEKFPKLNEQSESMNTYSDLGPKEVYLYSDLGPKEVLPHMDLNPTEENPYSDLGPKEVTLYSDLGPKEMIPHLDLGPKKVKHTRFWARKK